MTRGRKWGEKESFAEVFSHSLPVSFPSREFLKTPATQAIHSKAEKFEIRNHLIIMTSSLSQSLDFQNVICPLSSFYLFSPVHPH